MPMSPSFARPVETGTTADAGGRALGVKSPWTNSNPHTRRTTSAATERTGCFLSPERILDSPWRGTPPGAVASDSFIKCLVVAVCAAFWDRAAKLPHRRRRPKPHLQRRRGGRCQFVFQEGFIARRTEWRKVAAGPGKLTIRPGLIGQCSGIHPMVSGVSVPNQGFGEPPACVRLPWEKALKAILTGLSPRQGPQSPSGAPARSRHRGSPGERTSPFPRG